MALSDSRLLPSYGQLTSRGRSKLVDSISQLVNGGGPVLGNAAMSYLANSNLETTLTPVNYNAVTEIPISADKDSDKNSPAPEDWEVHLAHYSGPILQIGLTVQSIQSLIAAIGKSGLPKDALTKIIEALQARGPIRSAAGANSRVIGSSPSGGSPRNRSRAGSIEEDEIQVIPEAEAACKRPKGSS
ncbi:hypothetical protein SISNIDRAFT_316055 [Sistotremastrum niveocremeum HHB9708]|uniref:Uncharacterized protein n=1 Tax=Sistotremastrum niveocremeum HHB9708 TaxID=1314777 RepID=A0A164Y0E7_9AGAM|nr:hypothetical protein SISNIDRAFT_316055 [Sistotremastrum niveocremeum HHB9708]